MNENINWQFESGKVESLKVGSGSWGNSKYEYLNTKLGLKVESQKIRKLAVAVSS